MQTERLELILKLLKSSTPAQIKSDFKALEANRVSTERSIKKAEKERGEVTAQLEAKLAAVEKQIEVLAEPYNKRISAAETALHDTTDKLVAIEHAAKFNDFLAALAGVTDVASFARAWLIYNTDWDSKDMQWLDRRMAELHFRSIENSKGCLIVGWLENDYNKADKFYLAIKRGRVISALRVVPAQHAGDYQYAKSLGVKVLPKKNDWDKEGPQGLNAWLELDFIGFDQTKLIDFLS